MQTDVKTVRPEATVQEAAQEMEKHDVGSLVVVSGAGQLVGIITDSDIINDVVAKGSDIKDVKVSDIMSKDVMVASPDATLEEAADVMNKYKIKHLPVVEKGALVGIVTATDLITYEEALVEKIAALLMMRRGAPEIGG